MFKELGKEIYQRLTSETPTWFKAIAWICGVITVVCLSLYAGQVAGEIALPPAAFEWIKRIGIACGAVAGVSSTAKK